MHTQGRLKPKRVTALVKALPSLDDQARLEALPASEGRRFVTVRELVARSDTSNVTACSGRWSGVVGCVAGGEQAEMGTGNWEGETLEIRRGCLTATVPCRCCALPVPGLLSAVVAPLVGPA